MFANPWNHSHRNLLLNKPIRFLMQHLLCIQSHPVAASNLEEPLSNLSGHTHFSLPTGDWQGVANLSEDLCNWGLSYAATNWSCWGTSHDFFSTHDAFTCHHKSYFRQPHYSIGIATAGCSVCLIWQYCQGGFTLKYKAPWGDCCYELVLHIAIYTN